MRPSQPLLTYMYKTKRNPHPVAVPFRCLHYTNGWGLGMTYRHWPQVGLEEQSRQPWQKVTWSPAWLRVSWGMPLCASPSSQSHCCMCNEGTTYHNTVVLWYIRTKDTTCNGWGPMNHHQCNHNGFWQTTALPVLHSTVEFLYSQLPRDRRITVLIQKP